MNIEYRSIFCRMRWLHESFISHIMTKKNVYLFQWNPLPSNQSYDLEQFGQLIWICVATCILLFDNTVNILFFDLINFNRIYIAKWEKEAEKWRTIKGQSHSLTLTHTHIFIFTCMHLFIQERERDREEEERTAKTKRNQHAMICCCCCEWNEKRRGLTNTN